MYSRFECSLIYLFLQRHDAVVASRWNSIRGETRISAAGLLLSLRDYPFYYSLFQRFACKSHPWWAAHGIPSLQALQGKWVDESRWLKPSSGQRQGSEPLRMEMNGYISRTLTVTRKWIFVNQPFNYMKKAVLERDCKITTAKFNPSSRPHYITMVIIAFRCKFFSPHYR